MGFSLQELHWLPTTQKIIPLSFLWATSL